MSDCSTEFHGTSYKVSARLLRAIDPTGTNAREHWKDARSRGARSGGFTPRAKSKGGIYVSALWALQLEWLAPPSAPGSPMTDRPFHEPLYRTHKTCWWRGLRFALMHRRRSINITISPNKLVTMMASYLSAYDLSLIFMARHFRTRQIQKVYCRALLSSFLILWVIYGLHDILI